VFHRSGPVTQVLHGGPHTRPGYGIYEIRDAGGKRYHVAAPDGYMKNLAEGAKIPVAQPKPDGNLEKFRGQMLKQPIVEQGYAGQGNPLETIERPNGIRLIQPLRNSQGSDTPTVEYSTSRTPQPARHPESSTETSQPGAVAPGLVTQPDQRRERVA